MNKVRIKNKELYRMLDELSLGSKKYIPSDLWQMLSVSHTKMLGMYGFDYFKRYINGEYFDWKVSGIYLHQLQIFFSEICRGNIKPILRSKFIGKNGPGKAFKKFEFLSKVIYRLYVAYLYDYVSKIDHLGLLKKISEPSLGSPLLVDYRDRFISQDLCNSVHEFYSITKETNINKELKIGEIGAGYGRLAYVFLKVLQKSSYCIIDIPPALFISQEYLRKLFPREKIFLFRPFTNFKKIEHEFKNARIKFLLPHQIEYLPEDYFDIMVNISSLHEMRRNQINNYIKQENRLTQGFVYLKQWKKAKAKDNNFIREEEYPIPLKWKKIFHRTHPIQKLFFEALYRTR